MSHLCTFAIKPPLTLNVRKFTVLALFIDTVLSGFTRVRALFCQTCVKPVAKCVQKYTLDKHLSIYRNWHSFLTHLCNVLSWFLNWHCLGLKWPVLTTKHCLFYCFKPLFCSNARSPTGMLSQRLALFWHVFTPIWHCFTHVLTKLPLSHGQACRRDDKKTLILRQNSHNLRNGHTADYSPRK